MVVVVVGLGVKSWGWFWFFTRPMFLLLDFFGKSTGNFGIAILLLTIVVRFIFYPLANTQFRSMSRMKTPW